MAKERGGARQGAGRKPKAVELKSAELCKAVLVDLYGGEREGLIAAWRMGEPTIIKFILEHAFGKPTDNLNLSGGLDNTTNYDLTKVSKDTLKELLNAASADKSSKG